MAVATQVEHMPPKAFFDSKLRPNELIFPACRDCNRGSSDLDTILAFVGRFYAGEPKPEHRSDFPRVIKAVREDYPEIYLAFEVRPAIKHGAAELYPFHFDSPYVIRCLELFGAKLGLALHWRETQRVIPPEGGVLVKLYTNADAMMGKIPPVVFDTFSDLRTLQQGTFHVGDQFVYQSHGDNDAGLTLHFAGFRASLAMLVIAAEDCSRIPEVDESDVMRPGCLKDGYPYGLPRMSIVELNWRLRRQQRIFASVE